MAMGIEQSLQHHSGVVRWAPLNFLLRGEFSNIQQTMTLFTTLATWSAGISFSR